MNPYARFLGGREPLPVLAASSEQLRSVAASLGAVALEHRPAPGKWSAREILCHLADNEITFAFRLRQALAEAGHVVQPYDQTQWAGTYGAYPADAALDAFAALRRWNLLLLEALPPSGFARPLMHPERGAMTVQELVETTAGHDLNHLGQLEAMARSWS